MKDHIFRIAVTAQMSWILGGWMAAKMLPAAWAERGYWAVGGEWLLILLAAAVGGWLGSCLADRVIDTEAKKNGPPVTSTYRRAQGCEDYEASRPKYNLGGLQMQENAKPINISIEASGKISVDPNGGIMVGSICLEEALYTALPERTKGLYLEDKSFNGAITVIVTEDPLPYFRLDGAQKEEADE